MVIAQYIARALVTLGALVALGSVAEGRPPPPPDEEYITDDAPPEEPAFNLLGMRVGVGVLPIDGQAPLVVSIGVGVEHPVFRKTRVFGEYDWLWMTYKSERDMDSVAPRPERHATGHRPGLGLRRELAGKSVGSKLRMFIDGELGASLALANDNMTGLSLIPASFLGLRFGYDIYTRNDDSPSRTFEVEFLVRATASLHGVGTMFGLGMLWGN